MWFGIQRNTYDSEVKIIFIGVYSALISAVCSESSKTVEIKTSEKQEIYVNTDGTTPVKFSRPNKNTEAGRRNPNYREPPQKIEGIERSLRGGYDQERFANFDQKRNIF